MNTIEKAWTDDMGEISGFGGGYEAVCRAMVMAGIRWIDEHPSASLTFQGFKDVFGLVTEESADAKALVKAMMDAPVLLDGQQLQARVGDDCTSAMHHAAVNHVVVYKRLGWDAYTQELREREKSEADGAQEP